MQTEKHEQFFEPGLIGLLPIVRHSVFRKMRVLVQAGDSNVLAGVSFQNTLSQISINKYGKVSRHATSTLSLCFAFFRPPGFVDG
jgi:hypothetical protein